jgi:hypothetical protein
VPFIMLTARGEELSADSMFTADSGNHSGAR